MAPTLELRLGTLPHRAALNADIEQRLAKLGARYASLLRCRVTVDRTDGRTLARSAIDVAMELLLPGREILVQSERPRADINAALSDAFNVAEGALARHATIY